MTMHDPSYSPLSAAHSQHSHTHASHITVYAGTGNLVVSGVQLGNVWIGVQPALGIEGDPMRLLFERDLTPHPQYAAFYHWLNTEFGAHALLHLGMHGTAEWLPGAPLGESLAPSVS